MPTAADTAYVARFGATERALHWIHAAGFMGMLASGLALFLPALSAGVSRPTLKAAHLGVAAAWMTLLVVVALAGDHRALRATRREFEAFEKDDAQWLRRRPSTPGRFNAGQKFHAIAQAALAVLFVISGALLWLGERNNAFQFPGSLALHDAATLIGLGLVTGHLFLALVWPTTRPALRGIVRGTVRADWARRHHAGWSAPRTAGRRARLGRTRAVVAGVALLAGGVSTMLLTRSSLADRAPSEATAAPVPATPAARAAPLTALDQAREFDAAGRLPDALAFYEQAAAIDPRRADVRATLGFALARAGDLPRAESELRAAVRLDRQDPEARLYLGTVQVQAGKKQAGRQQLRRVLELDGSTGPNAAIARRLLAEG